MAFNTSADLLVKYLNTGLKLVPLRDDAKTPNIKSWRPIYDNPNYWTEDKLRKESHRFVNVATCFGKTINDKQGLDTYLPELDIDSQKVYDLLFVMEPSLTAYAQNFTFVIKTKKSCGWRILWREHKQHKAIHTQDCKAGCEFEIKTDDYGLSSLPDSTHRDEPEGEFHYKNTGKSALGICDGFYDKIMSQLSECLTEHKTKQQQQRSNGSTNSITLTTADIQVICGSISPYYNKPHRQKLALALAGLLHKSSVGPESALQLIELLAKGDEEKNSRIAAVEETYKKDAFPSQEKDGF
ncbi:MAG: hypothetical protein DLM72_07010 [Candidatus Nitrosopolaris wilkensis]|nr:MAG: hypothetical protein DLM72_07010 [Candidatus Nitrosopolaris wilkensis]